MRKYTGGEERAIRVRRLVDEWTHSGLLDAAQRSQIVPELQVDLRRTNLFLRLTLVCFGVLLAGASVGLAGVMLGVNSTTAGGMLCWTAAVVLLGLAEVLSGKFRLYRFGIEEACAAAAALLAGFGSALIVGRLAWDRPGQSEACVGLIAGSAAAFAIYRRFGYVYAAVGAMLCAAAASFQLPLSAVIQRFLAAVILGACFAAARSKRLRSRDEFPGDEYGVVQASAWVAIYAVLNLHLDVGFTRTSHLPPAFYWATFAVVWILPAVSLGLAIRDRDRLFLDASLVLAVATLITNKPYLGMARKPWDPILFGVLLITVAVIVRRWLAAGPAGSRAGITGVHLLRSDKRSTTVVSTASGAFHPALTHQHGGPPPDDPFKGDGGRSGGAGGGAAY